MLERFPTQLDDGFCLPSRQHGFEQAAEMLPHGQTRRVRVTIADGVKHRPVFRDPVFETALANVAVDLNDMRCFVAHSPEDAHGMLDNRAAAALGDGM